MGSVTAGEECGVQGHTKYVLTQEFGVRHFAGLDVQAL